MPAMDNMFPPLTTVRPGFEQLGVAAMRETLYLLGAGRRTPSDHRSMASDWCRRRWSTAAPWVLSAVAKALLLLDLFIYSLLR